MPGCGSLEFLGATELRRWDLGRENSGEARGILPIREGPVPGCIGSEV